MRQARRHAGPLALAALLLSQLAAPAAGSAAWTDFLPRPLEKHAWFETYTSYERDNDEAGRNIRWDDTFFREKLTLESEGYSYDPRFLRYRLSIAGAGKQERYDTNAYASGDWEVDGGLEYDARISLLPEHPYGLLAYASRYEPVYRQQASVSHSNIAEDYGVTLRYQKKPYFMNGGFLDSQTHSSGNDSDVKRVFVESQYYKNLSRDTVLSASTALRPTWYSGSNQLDGNELEGEVGSVLEWHRLRLSTNVRKDDFHQSQNDLNDYDTKQLEAWELATLQLPWGFRTDLTWRLNNDESKVGDPDGAVPQRKYENDGNNVQFELIHRLYESLDTRYRLQSINNDTRGGSSDYLANGGGLNYTKQLPWRSRLLVDGDYTYSTFDNHGSSDIVNEPYLSTAVPGVLTLRQRNVDPDEPITIELRSPLPPNNWITLVEGTNYLVNRSVDPFEIQIILLPDDFAVPGNFDFYISYSLVGGDYELGQDFGGAGVSLEMLDNLITPYFRYSALRTDVLSGTYTAIPVDSNNYVGGLRSVYGPWRARGEYQSLDWQSNPFHAWRVELQYVGNITPTLTSYTTLYYLNRHYLGGEGPNPAPDYTEEIWTVSSNLTKQLFYRDLLLSIGGSWSRVSSLTDTDAWSVNSSLIWHFGKLDVTISASAYGATADNDYTSSYNRDHELVSINIRRQLW